MAEVLRALAESEINSFAPMRELRQQSQTNVYEAVADQLHLFIEFTGDLPEAGDFLVEVNGRAATFSFGILYSAREA
jgi:hypothetical protein